MEAALDGFGSETVGVSGVSQVGLTYLEPDAGGFTGIGSSFAGDGVEGTANLDNSWTLGSAGYRESFYPAGPQGIKVSFGGALTIEQFRSDFSASGDIVRGGVSLVNQETDATTRDNYYGVELSAGISKRFADNRLRLGAEAFFNPSYHTARAEISQVTGGAGGFSQSLQYSDDDFSAAGGVRLKMRYKLSSSAQIRIDYEYSILGNVTEVHVPANPNQQPASFSSGNVDRHFGKIGFSMKF